MRWITRFILFCVFGLVGCTPNAGESISTVSIEARPTSVITATLSPSPAPTQTPMITVTATVTLMPEPTWTPLPTLAPAQARQYVEELMTSNAGCKLPCWWGIVPGETFWAQAQHIVEPFIIEILEGDINKRTIDENITDTQNISLHYNVPGEKLPGHTLLGLRDDIVFFVDVWPPGTDRNYKLYQVLNEYGKPRDIFTELWSRPGWRPAFLILHYPEQGIIVEYEVDAEEFDSYYQACFHTTSPTLRLWDPELNLPFSDIYPYRDSMVWHISSLEESTGISVDDFFENYQNAADTECLEL